jgi:hypothetical protein
VFADPSFPGSVFERSLAGERRAPSIYDDPISKDEQLHPFYRNLGQNISSYVERILKRTVGRKSYHAMEATARNYQPAAPDWGNALSLVWILKSMKLDDARGNPLRDALRRILKIGPYEEADPYAGAHAIVSQSIRDRNKQLAEIGESIHRLEISGGGGPGGLGGAADTAHLGGGGEHAPPSSGTAGQAGLTAEFAQRGVDVEHMDAELVRRLNAAYRDAPPGQKFSLISGYRTYGQQVQAWRRLQGGRLGMVARPGTSRHEVGEASDVSDPSGWLHRHAGQYGLRNLRGDYPHFEKEESPTFNRRRRVSMNVDLSAVRVADASREGLKPVSIEHARMAAVPGPFEIHQLG